MSDEASTSATSQPKAKKSKMDQLDPEFPDNSNNDQSNKKECDDDGSETGSICGDGPPAIGIDLGTTNSSVAVFIDGQPQVLVDPDTNQTSIPSVVAFTETECLIGEPAKRQAQRNPKNTIFGSKRLIGQLFNSESVQEDRAHWPFEVIDSNTHPLIQVTYQGKIKSFSAVEIGSFILRKLKSIAENHLRRTVKDAVITVPANFTNRQREATKSAGQIAGLNVIRILNEPTAAAMAYGVEGVEQDRSVCVYDLGGGTFDVTVLTFKQSGAIRVASIAGNPHLGGEDIDNTLAKNVIAHIKTLPDYKDLEFSEEQKQRVKNYCVDAKHVLSQSESAIMHFKSFHNGKDLKVSLPRIQFEQMNAALFQHTINKVRQAIADANLDKGESDIKEIILVGGSTRIPKIPQLLEQAFPNALIRVDVDPDIVVAHGAAIQAALLNGDMSENISRMLLFDVIPLSLGVRASGGRMEVILKKNTTTPCSCIEPYGTKIDNQRTVDIDIYEGEDEIAINNNLLGSIKLINLPDMSRRVKRIMVKFTVDEDGVLTVTANVRKTQIEKSIDIEHNTGRLNDAEIRRMIANAEEALKQLK